MVRIVKRCAAIIPAGSYARPPLMYPYVVEVIIEEEIGFQRSKSRGLITYREEN